MSDSTPISIMIHDLNPWGGQDRSMLEIAWEMNKTLPLEIHSYSLEGYEQWPSMTHIKYQTLFKRPAIYRNFNYHLKSMFKLLGQKKKQIIQSTGTASLRSDVVQVQFIHQSWQNVSNTLSHEMAKTSNPIKGLYHNRLRNYELKLEKKIYTPEKHFIAISHGIKKELMEYFNIPQENITIIYHGVDTNHFIPVEQTQDGLSNRSKDRQELGFDDEDIVFLHVGALNARKGIFKTLQTISYLKKNNFNNIKLLAVGQGDHKVLQKLIVELDIEDKVHIISHSKDIRKYFWASDLFFFPTNYEPFGLVILEAMACGMPVATTSCAGAAELIDDGHSGVLFSAEDSVESIANKLNPFIKSSDKRKSLGQEARIEAEKHSWGKVGSEYVEFYKNYEN